MPMMISLICFILFDINTFIPVIIIGLILISGTNGLEVNLKENIFRKYGSFLRVKIGKWKPLGRVVSAKLALSTESSTVGGMSSMAGGFIPNKGKLKSITYDVYVITETGEIVRVYDFLKYNHAKQALKEIGLQMEVPVSDKVRDKLNENRGKRSSRRR